MSERRDADDPCNGPKQFLRDGMRETRENGGARPYYVERTPDDLYQSVLFPNFHYVKVTVEKDRLRGAMYRLENPEAPVFRKELKDAFEIPMKPR